MTSNENNLSNNKVKIGISWLADIDEGNKDINAYINAIKMVGAEPIYLNQIANEENALNELAKIDALVMSGGEDINPNLYGEDKLDTCGKINDIRDKSDCLLLNAAIKKDIPVVAVCRGMQLLNALCGGSLYQDLPTEFKTDIIHRDPQGLEFVYHDIEVKDNNIIATALGGAGKHEINSWHHQGVKKIGNNLEVVAKAADGMVEGIVLTSAKYIYGVQFHPERLVAEGKTQYLSVFKALVEEVANR